MFNHFRLDNQSSVLKAVDDFVFRCNNLGVPPDQFISELKELIPAFNVFIQEGVVYSTYIQAFLRLVEYIDQLRHKRDYETYFNSLSKAEVYRFRDQLRHCEKDLAVEIKRYAENKRHNREAFDSYINAIFANYSRGLVIRVDLSYLQESQHLVTLDRFSQDVEILRKYLQYRQGLVEHLLGYGMALEQGDRKGFHIHLYLIFNAHKVQRDEYYGYKLIELWQGITQGIGMGYNVNSKENKEKYQMMGTLGIGEIFSADQNMRKNTSTVAEYLNHDDKWSQRLLIRTPKMRTFTKGELEPRWVLAETQVQEQQADQSDPAPIGAWTAFDRDLIDS